ncbi:MAG: T9SS type A sorting domain-containing protein [Janthinobacterium lividum]
MSTTTFIPFQQPRRYSRWFQLFVPLLALFVGLGAAQQVQAQSTVVSDSVTINTGGLNHKYDTQATTSGTNNFQGTDFGSFDINTGMLSITGATIRINQATGSNYDQADLIIQVFQGDFSTPPSSVAPLIISLTDKGIDQNTGYRVYTYTGSAINVVSLVNNGGVSPGTTYRFDARFRVIDNIGNSNPPFIFTPFVRSIFEVTGTLPTTDTWTGNINDDWFRAGNWSLNAIPDATTNVVIPNFGPGVTNRYPNIISGQAGTTTSGTAVNNTGSGPAAVRNLFLAGNNSTTDRSIMRIDKGQLNIYGNFSNQFLSFIARDNTVVNFAGTTVAQNIGGGTFATVTVSGTANKNITGPVNVSESFNFDTSAGNFLVITDSQNPSTSFVQLADRLTQNQSNGAQLIGETNSSYIYGLVQTSRANVAPNEATARTFGNIGFTALFTGSNVPGDVAVTRSTVGPNYYINGAYSVRRVFGVRPSYTNSGGGPLHANVTFTVLPNETQNLKPGNGSISPANLSLFVSTNGGSVFTQLGRDAAPVTNPDGTYTVTKSNITTFATFTLGDVAKPLPVQLVSFDAKRSGTDVLVTWATALEVNNAGFEVQESANGIDFRNLIWVASTSPNSQRYQSYSYTDNEAGKSGIRYYRLLQRDQDGKESYSGVKVVSFGSKGEANALAVYPNPFLAGDQTTLSISATQAGNATLQVLDVTGRSLYSSTISTVAGVNELAVPTASSLSSGLYLVKVTFANGEVQTTRMQKQ